MEKIEEEAEIDVEQMIKGFKKIPPKYITTALVLSLFFLFFYLGYMYGFNQSFKMQDDYYEEKMSKYCICNEKPIYNISNIQPLEINKKEKEIDLASSEPCY